MKSIELLWAWMFKKIFKRQYEDFKKNLDMVTESYEDIIEVREMAMDFYAAEKPSDLRRAQKKHQKTMTKLTLKTRGHLKHEGLKKFELHSKIQKLNDSIERV